jgi:ATP-dependent Clp protease adapter protein ClpS
MQEGKNITWMYTYKKKVTKAYTLTMRAQREKMTPMPKIEEKKRKGRTKIR